MVERPGADLFEPGILVPEREQAFKAHISSYIRPGKLKDTLIPSVKYVAYLIQLNQSRYQLALIKADTVHAIHAGLGISLDFVVFRHNNPLACYPIYNLS